MPHSNCKQRALPRGCEGARRKGLWMDLIWEVMKEKEAMKRLAVTGRFIAKGDRFSTARTKNPWSIEQDPESSEGDAPHARASVADAFAHRFARCLRTRLLIGGAGAGCPSGVGDRRNAQLPAKAAGQIGDHAQAVGDRGGNLGARERELRVQQEARDRRFKLGFNGCRGGAAGRGLLALAAMQGRPNLADETLRYRDGEIDLQRNRQAGL